VAQEASGSAADTVTVDGKGQVDPGTTKDGTEDADVSVTAAEEEPWVPDLGPLPALNPAPRPRREVVEDSALGAKRVELRPLVSQGSFGADPVMMLGVTGGFSDAIALTKLPVVLVNAYAVPCEPVEAPSLLAVEMLLP